MYILSLYLNEHKWVFVYCHICCLNSGSLLNSEPRGCKTAPNPTPACSAQAQPPVLSQWFPCQALFVKASHVDKRMLLRGTEQNTLLLQAGWRVGMAHQLLSILGPITSFWLPFVQQKPWFTECLKKIQTCLLKVSITCVIEQVPAPRGGARLRSPFMQGEVPLLVFPFSILLHQRLPSSGNKGVIEYR